MKINVRQNDGRSDVSVFLTEREAEDIALALRFRLDGKEGFRVPGYNLHVEDGEGSG